MRIEDCFSLEHHIVAERLPLIKYFTNYGAIVMLHVGVFLSEEVDLLTEFCMKIKTSKAACVSRVKSAQITKLLHDRINPTKKIPFDGKLYEFSHIDETINIIQLQSNQMISELVIEPKWGALADGEISLYATWFVCDDVVKFATEIDNKLIERKFVSPHDLFIYNKISIKNFISKYHRIQILFRLVYKINTHISDHEGI